MSKSPAEFVVVPVGTPMPREQVEARAARLREAIPQYRGSIEVTRRMRGDKDAKLIEHKVEELQARLAELEALLKAGN